MDIIFLAVLAVFFAKILLLIQICDRQRGAK